MVSTCSSSRTSAVIPIERRPSRSTSATTGSTGSWGLLRPTVTPSGRRATTTTLAPAFASARLVALPSPCEPPDTMATRSVRSKLVTNAASWTFPRNVLAGRGDLTPASIGMTPSLTGRGFRRQTPRRLGGGVGEKHALPHRFRDDDFRCHGHRVAGRLHAGYSSVRRWPGKHRQQRARGARPSKVDHGRYECPPAGAAFQAAWRGGRFRPLVLAGQRLPHRARCLGNAQRHPRGGDSISRPQDVDDKSRWHHGDDLQDQVRGEVARRTTGRGKGFCVRMGGLSRSRVSRVRPRR